MREIPSEARILELEATVALLKAELAELRDNAEKDRKTLRKFMVAYDSDGRATVNAIVDLRESIKMIEPNVYPHLGKLLEHIFDTVGSASEDKPDPTLPPPSKPPPTK